MAHVLYENLDFQGCIDKLLDFQDLFAEIKFQRMSDAELHTFAKKITELQLQAEATLLSMKYLQGVRDERRNSS